MASLLTPQHIERVRALIQDSMTDTIYQDEIIWRTREGVDRWKEDHLPLAKVDKTLKGLYSYNYFRQWQINVDTISGTLDKVTEAILFSRKYLAEQGLIREDGSVIFDAGEDEFYVRGRWYKIVGDSDISQLPNVPLLYMIVLQRQEQQSGKPFKSVPAGLITRNIVSQLWPLDTLLPSRKTHQTNLTTNLITQNSVSNEVSE